MLMWFGFDDNLLYSSIFCTFLLWGIIRQIILSFPMVIKILNSYSWINVMQLDI